MDSDKCDTIQSFSHVFTMMVNEKISFMYLCIIKYTDPNYVVTFQHNKDNCDIDSVP